MHCGQMHIDLLLTQVPIANKQLCPTRVREKSMCSNLMFNPFGSQFEKVEIHANYPVAIVQKKSNHKFSLVVKTNLLPVLLKNVEYDKIEFTDYYPSLLIKEGDNAKMVDYHDIILENDSKQTL